MQSSESIADFADKSFYIVQAVIFNVSKKMSFPVDTLTLFSRYMYSYHLGKTGLPAYSFFE